MSRLLKSAKAAAISREAGACTHCLTVTLNYNVSFELSHKMVGEFLSLFLLFALG